MSRDSSTVMCDVWCSPSIPGRWLWISSGGGRLQPMCRVQMTQAQWGRDETEGRRVLCAGSLVNWFGCNRFEELVQRWTTWFFGFSEQFDLSSLLHETVLYLCFAVIFIEISLVSISKQHLEFNCWKMFQSSTSKLENRFWVKFRTMQFLLKLKDGIEC